VIVRAKKKEVSLGLGMEWNGSSILNVLLTNNALAFFKLFIMLIFILV